MQKTKTINPAVFKSYDIRAIYPSDLDEDTAYAIARAYVDEFSLTNIAIGRDKRTSSESLFEAFTRGLMDAGADVTDLGLASTPMVYFASGTLDVDGAVVLTASHNPAEYNGFKLNLKNAVPIGAGSGMERIRDRAIAGVFLTPEKKGVLNTASIQDAYAKEILSAAALGDTSLTVVVDSGNGMGVLELPILEALTPTLTLHHLYDTIDMSFPNHEANPMNTETLSALQARVRETGANLGIAYDGDADRVGFVDETGATIRMDSIGAIIARDILTHSSGATILYDLRSSNAVADTIKKAGGVAQECRVGHAHIKRHMAELDAVFAAELSGHYYFKAMSYGESATLAALHILNVLSQTGRPLSTLVAEVQNYFQSGEINSVVDDTDAMLAKIEDTYSDGTISHLDGIKVVYDDWWFNVRASNTEPLLRLNLEAHTQALMEEKRDELLALIQN